MIIFWMPNIVDHQKFILKYVPTRSTRINVVTEFPQPTQQKMDVVQQINYKQATFWVNK